MNQSKWKPYKNILALAWPLIVANSFWNLQLTIDRIFLAQYSTEALGAAMAVMGIFWTPMALLQQTVSYLMTFVAQYFGAKEYDKIGPAVIQALYVSTLGGVFFIGFIFFSPVLFDWINHDLVMQKLEVSYFNSLTYSALPAALVAAASAFFTGLGSTQVILVINFAGLLANAFFDYLLIYGKWGFPELGIAGAGYATALGNWASALVGIWLLFRNKQREEYGLFKSFRFDLDLMKRFLKYGFPSGMQWALEGLAFTVFLIFVGKMSNGSIALASSSIAVTVMMLAILPAMGVAQSISILVGQHLGENAPDKAEFDSWIGLKISAAYILLVALTFLFLPELYLNWFENKSDPQLWSQVKDLARIILIFVGLFVTFDSMNLIFSFALKGAGDTRFVSSVALIMPWPLMVFPTWLWHLKENAIYWAWGAASIYIVLQSLVFLHRFRGGKWKKMSVIH